MKAAFEAGLIPILCIGETQEERDAGGGGHLPRGRGRAAQGVGRAQQGAGDRPAYRRRQRLGDLRRAVRRQGARRRRADRRHRRPPAQQEPPHGGAQEGAPRDGQAR